MLKIVITEGQQDFNQFESILLKIVNKEGIKKKILKKKNLSALRLMTTSAMKGGKERGILHLKESEGLEIWSERMLDDSLNKEVY